MDLNPVAIELDFVDPALAAWHPPSGARQIRSHAMRRFLLPFALTPLVVGGGVPPEPKAHTPTSKVERSKSEAKPQPGLSAESHSRGLAALMIFSSIVALIVVYRILTQ
jgi:hypothetical protein